MATGAPEGRPQERDVEDEGEGVPVDVDSPPTVCCARRQSATGYAVVPNMKHLAEQECCGCCPPCLGSPVGLCFLLLQLVLVLGLLLAGVTAAARCAARHGHGDLEAWASATAMGNRSAWALVHARAAAPAEVARLAAHATNSTLAYLADHADLADRLCDRGGDWLRNGSLPAGRLAWLRGLHGANITLSARVAALWERAPGGTAT